VPDKRPSHYYDELTGEPILLWEAEDSMLDPSWGLQGWGCRFRTKEEAQAYGAQVSANPVILAYSDSVKHQLLWQEDGVDYGSKNGLMPPTHTPLVLTSVHLDSIEGVTPVTVKSESVTQKWREAQLSLIAAGLSTTVRLVPPYYRITGGTSRVSDHPIVYQDGFVVFEEGLHFKIATTSTRLRALDDTSYDSLPAAISALVEEVVRTKDELSPPEKLRKVLEGIRQQMPFRMASFMSTPHEVSPPSTDAEIASSDNKVIREAYAKDTDPALDDLRKACEVAGLVAVEKGTLEDEKARSASWRESYETIGAKADEDRARAEKAEVENANLKTTIVAMDAEAYKAREEDYRISKELKATIAKLEKELSELKSAPVQKSDSSLKSWYCPKHPEYLFRTIREVEISERAPTDTTSKIFISSSQKEPNSKLVLKVAKEMIDKPAETYELDCSVEEAITRLNARGITHWVGVSHIDTALLPLPEPFTESEKQKLSEVIRGYFRPPLPSMFIEQLPSGTEAIYDESPPPQEPRPLSLGALFGVVLGTSLLTLNRPKNVPSSPLEVREAPPSPLVDEDDEGESHQGKRVTS